MTISKILTVKMCMHDLNLDLHNGPRSNANMPIEIPYTISNLMSMVNIAFPFTVFKTFAFGICIIVTMTLTFSRSNVNMAIESQYTTSYLTQIANVFPNYHHFQHIHW